MSLQSNKANPFSTQERGSDRRMSSALARQRVFSSAIVLVSCQFRAAAHSHTVRAGTPPASWATDVSSIGYNTCHLLPLSFSRHTACLLLGYCPGLLSVPCRCTLTHGQGRHASCLLGH
ncbi:hypothetical protein J6590_036181 [Homalodisca vitripennis]|nr:hypothetical protein J6590_036181 [Homalodisca vitripennis]